MFKKIDWAASYEIGKLLGFLIKEMFVFTKYLSELWSLQSEYNKQTYGNKVGYMLQI